MFSRTPAWVNYFTVFPHEIFENVFHYFKDETKTMAAPHEVKRRDELFSFLGDSKSWRLILTDMSFNFSVSLTHLPVLYITEDIKKIITIF